MQTRIEPSKKAAKYWFDSLAELQRYIADTSRTWINQKNSETNHPSRNWDLQAGYEGAVQMARDGWLEGAQQAQETLKALPQGTPAPITKTDFYGFMPHVPRYCAGAPDSMIRHATPPREGMGRVLTLIVPCNALADVKAEYMRNYGLALAQYVNQLETDGVRCEIIGLIASSVSSWRVSHAWRVKSADQPLDLAVMAFSCGHPAMFRRLGFALRERCAAPRDACYGQSVPAELADVINAPAGAIVLNGMYKADEYARTHEAALSSIEAQIDKAIDNPEAE